MTISNRTAAVLASGIAGAALLVPLSPAAPAAAATSAGSIVFIKDYNVWIAAGDGSGARPLTTDGYDALPYRHPSQSDTGLVAASRYATIVTLDQQGNPIAEIDPPALPGSGGHNIDGAPVAVSVSPDGNLIAYSFAENCGPGCGFRTATGYISSAGTDPAAKGTTFLNNPSWVTSTRTLQSGGYGSQVMIHDVGPAAPRHWFDDSDIWDPSTDFDNVEVSPDGKLLAGVRGTGDILTYNVKGDVRSGNPPGLPGDGCFLDDDADKLWDPTWGPDSDTLAFSGAEGIFTFDEVKRNVCSESTIKLIIPGGSEPDWAVKQLSGPTMNSVTIPEITGKAVVGGTLRTSNGTWTAPPTDYTYQWFREDTPIAGANDKTYDVTAADAGLRIMVVVTANRPGWPAGSSNSHAVSIAEGSDDVRNTRKPTIQGTAAAGRTVKATPGSWSPTPTKVSFQWLRDGAAIPGATSAKYRIARSDRGHRLTVRVTAVSGDSRASATSKAVTVRR